MSKRWGIAVIATIGLVGGGRGLSAQLGASPFHVDIDPPSVRMVPGSTQTLHAIIRVPANHYLYKEKTFLEFVTLEGIRVAGIRLPGPVKRFDPFFKKEVEIYESDVAIAATLEAPPSLTLGQRELQATVSYQGCSEKLCFRPEEVTVAWIAEVGPTPDGTVAAPPLSQHTDVTRNAARSTQDAGRPTTDGSSWRHLLSLPDFRGILARGVGIAFLLTFIGGLLTAFTPCVLPLLPVILLIIGIHPGAHRRNFLLALCLTVGLALTYAVIGLVGALAGIPMSYLFQQRWFLALVVAFYLAMAASMFGCFAFQLPAAWRLRLQRLGGAGYKGAFCAGISTGLLATPCAGPVIGGLVAYVGAQRDIGFGFLLLLTYGLGFGMIFLLLGTFYGRLTEHIRRPYIARAVKMLLGLLLLLPALYYGWVLFGGSPWQGDEGAAFAKARSLGRPVVIEFTAKSCPPCLVMERTTLRDPRVVQALTNDVVPLKIDATFGSDAVEEILERYRVVGWPTILLASPTGEVFWDLSLVGEIPSADRLLQAIAEARRRSAS